MKDRQENFKERCRQAGLKITPQRIEVYKALTATSAHPSVEMVYDTVRKVLPEISLDTVNRTLNTFAEIGLAFVVPGWGDVKRFDGNVHSHQHFRCVKCRRVIDYEDDTIEKIEVPASLEGKCKILRKSFCLEGLCENCRSHPKTCFDGENEIF